MDYTKWIREMNQCWQEYRFEDLAEYFHEDVFMQLSDAKDAIRGKQAMVEGYRQFLEMAKVDSVEIGDVTQESFNQTVVCRLEFTIGYEYEGEKKTESGLETYIIDASQNDPKIVWRLQQTFV